MLHHEDIKNLSELKSTFVDKHDELPFYLNFLRILKIGQLHSIYSSAKVKGVCGVKTFEILFCFRFVSKSNVHQFMDSSIADTLGYGKDVYYRLKGNFKINWRSFLFGVATRSLEAIRQYSSDSRNEQSGIKALIFDDTTIEKTGYKIEGVSRVWNHVVGRSVLGYQLLVMGYFDGTFFIPLDFSFHREKGKNKKNRFGLKPKHYRGQRKKLRGKSSPGDLRKKELDEKKTSMAVKMIKRAVAKGIDADYILTDSWFTCWELVKTALDNKLIYVGMFSKVKTKLHFQGKPMTYKVIRGINRKKIKRNKRFNLYYIRVVVEWKSQPIVLYFTRKGKNGNWKILLSTDLSSDFNQTVEAYQARWSIEVFFKECKQLLGLGKSQSTDFDVQVADTTITMVQYIFLAVQHRMNNYESLGRLFENTKAEVLEMRLHQRLLALLIAIVQTLTEIFEQCDSDQLMETLIHDPAVFEKLKPILYPSSSSSGLAA
jgi:hypothetical protein